MEDLKTIFQRNTLEGEQDISTIKNFDDYLESLLNPFSNIITSEILSLNSLKNSISFPIQIEKDLINNLQIEDSKIQNKYIFINQLSAITTESNDYINNLNLNKTAFINILNDKANNDTPLTRPVLKTVIDTNNSAITRGYLNNIINSYTLPNPIPNTRLFVNRTGTELIWA